MKEKYDKHAYYLAAVQDPISDVERISKIYREIFKKDALSLREDFSGTYALSCCWVQSSKNRSALAIDLDPEAIAYGDNRYRANLSDDEQSRVESSVSNSLQTTSPKDIIATFNFSYCLLTSRALLLEYFKHAYSSLNEEGMLILDIFGGSDSEIPEIQEREVDDHDHLESFLFEFERKDFNPISRIANYGIHFKFNNGDEYLDAFTYCFRMWSIPEIRDLLAEAGFSSSKVYWEDFDEEGLGNGEFYQTESEENSVNWSAYIVGIK
ncbi:conserved hypothetical protein [Halobacteriovorax marinus SJ]|uniref:Methyltransferase type 11 domain-containing protein n=1 Tax=Halobacteriovorax marinus (strain ATCC BAA-682 / DSM 15412 / SJ) TaxID=862908 RepID=E1WX53_HALMS|nr:hypothetical protein [Halobacteriovorax marinus]CBW25754.1 conserved hypothetical protein [Halobacteriovorax marinus SJ]